MKLSLLTAAFAALASVAFIAGDASAGQVAADVGQWRVIERESGPTNYYVQVHDGAGSYIRGYYRPGLETTVLGWQVPDNARAGAQTLRWRWRVEAFPKDADECASGKTDSAAVIYATWKRGLHWYTIKYVWSTVGGKGNVCDKHRNPFSSQDTVILESGGASDQWHSEEIDLKAEFRRHFEDGRADADVPDFVGIGIMSDGDQTHSDSAADYGSFTIDG
ncbi:MAG TPA: DUF3047 domain-containing protein [Polyangiaceae bacterium]|nr:DUF3047 domain-containing protein [Polyangiaceae bacterium]